MKRRIAREMAIQSLYQMEMNGVNPEQAVEMVMDEAKQEESEISSVHEREAKAMFDHVVAWVSKTWEERAAIDERLALYLKNWQVDRLSRVDRQILRFAAYELMHREDVPPKVAVNEAVVLAKHFGTDESGKFVNGVLGQMLREFEAQGTSLEQSAKELGQESKE
ncbi:transcription antitermination factor NusB [Paenibacillus aquistagni]|uniref:Transcription antitermination protein NusB n=1 Tax=Paenibacillus aquistagni TaxID=1852522 RepID=A0A1X7JJH9_9BACL|nr:transcription antitermination factor NusB [Paenibacillus aquistagni]NMM54498.1 transcription antitermination factor NusB [Paenibacillus aquistagni]SMG27902.1 NusB antitermination factor [Paenibacillus aquistagni]